MSQQPAAGSQIESEASEWLLAMQNRTVSAEQRHQFNTWLRASPEHERVYRAQEIAWGAIGNMRHLLDDSDGLYLGRLHSLHNEQSRAPGSPSTYTRHLATAAALLLIFLGATLLAPRLPWFSSQSQFATTTGQMRDLKLEDGTVVTLGGDSQIRVSFGRADRRVVLSRGQAFFAVTRDAARPFYVTAGNTMVRVLGTRFDVHYGPQAVRVAVVEGRVEVSSSPEDRVTDVSREEGLSARRRREASVRQMVDHVFLTAGEAAVASSTGQIATADMASIPDLSAWRQGRLVYVNTRLRDVIADINRYYDGKIEVTDPVVGDMQLTAAFRADQINRVLDVLENALPVRAVRVEDRRIVLERSPAH
jgi:transmembrane sensor